VYFVLPQFGHPFGGSESKPCLTNITGCLLRLTIINGSVLVSSPGHKALMVGRADAQLTRRVVATFLSLDKNGSFQPTSVYSWRIDVIVSSMI
jgi:hypothetical protein